MERKGRKEKAETIEREWLCLFQSGKRHAVCDCLYTIVPDVLVEIFAGT